MCNLIKFNPKVEKITEMGQCYPSIRVHLIFFLSIILNKCNNILINEYYNKQNVLHTL